MAIRVENEMQVYEIDGFEQKGLYSDKPHLRVIGHWNRSEFVILQFDGGKKFTVLASELKVAIENAKNTARF